MIRHLNFTGRVSIQRSHASFVLREDTPGLSFDARLELASYSFPALAPIIVEAYRQTVVQRFEWGTIAVPTPPKDRKLQLFAVDDNPLFRVKVLAPSNLLPQTGQLIGLLDQVRPIEPNASSLAVRSLLPIRRDQLSGQPWRLELTTRPVLVLDESLGDIRAVSRSRTFRGWVLPAAFRSILTQALCIDGRSIDEDDEDDSNDWRVEWIRFAKRLPGVEPTCDADGVAQWIEDSVAAFCRQHRLLPELVDELADDAR